MTSSDNSQAKPSGPARKQSEARETQEARVSSVKILNTSIPYIHEELLRLRNQAREAGQDPDTSLTRMNEGPEDAPADNEPAIPEVTFDPETKKPRTISQEDQDATARALKPHSRSTVALNQLRNRDLPDGMTPVQQTQHRPKGKKWQFGIRSRNAPYEAMKCLYSAIQAQQGDWEVIPALASDIIEEGKENMPPPPPEEVVEPGQRHKILQSRYPHLPNTYFVPRDPWFIRARMLKKGLFAPGVAPTLSRSNSQTNIKAEELRKRVVEMGGYMSEDLQQLHISQPNSGPPTRPTSTDPSHHTSPPTGQDSFTGPPPSNRTGTPITSHPSTLSHHSDMSVSSSAATTPNPHIGVYVYIDIQLYQLETNNYMVDFKCDGYQNVVFIPRNPNSVGASTKTSTRNTSTVTSPQSSRPTSGFDSSLTSTLSHHHTHDDSGPNSSIEPSDDDDNDQDSDDTEDDDNDTVFTSDTGTSGLAVVNGVRGTWKAVNRRYRNREKQITSPYPYLDVASDLIAQLAVSN